MRERFSLLRRSESDCERIRRLASIQLDCELSELGVRRLHRHLDGCALCSEFAASISATTIVLRRNTWFGAPRRAAGNEAPTAEPDVRRSLVRLDSTPPA